MLILGSRHLGKPVMSLQTGARLGVTERALIDPTNLTVAAYEVVGPLLTEHPTYLRVAEIREVGTVGMIIDGNDDLIGLDDVIRIKQLHEIDVKLIGMPVIDETKRRLGRVSDYTLESGGFVIKQLHVKRGVIRGITETSLLIHRGQVVRMTDNEIIVKTTAQRGAVEPVKVARRHDYVNPFRQPTPQTESTSDAS
jgi:uncharacterized protein YrrD